MSRLFSPARIGNVADMATARRKAIVAEVAPMVRDTLDMLPLIGPLDMDGMDVVVQRELWRIGGRWVEGALRERVFTCEAEPILCLRSPLRLWVTERDIGSGTTDAHTWAEPLCLQLKENGPESVLAAWRELSPASPQGSKVVVHALDYFSTHAKARRMDDPGFAA